MRARPKRRAIVLITVLFFTVLTLMFVGAAIALAPSSVARSANLVAMAAADRAAQSGVDWVRSRISQDPRWEARDTFLLQQPDLIVREGQGQVIGWIRGSHNWSRFRVRFNYQDGIASNDLASDGMDDPATLWTDFGYVSCNNLIGANPRSIPRAQSGSSTSTSQPWTQAQVTIPPNSMLVSVEGSQGKDVQFSGQEPLRFLGGYRKRTVQAVLKLGNNQPITAAAMMAAGGLTLSATSPIHLQSSGGEAARLRTKQALQVDGGIQTELADLRYGTSQTISGTYDPEKVNIDEDDTTGFFKIPYDKVRQPANPSTLAAGTYTVNANGQMMHIAMNYADYVAANPKPTGTAVALPNGLNLVGPNNDPTKPKFSLQISRDVQIQESGLVTDFALVPEGGAAQSENYETGAAASEVITPIPAAAPPQALPAMTVSSTISYWFNNPNGKPPITAATQAAWLAYGSSNMTSLGTTTSNIDGTTRSYHIYRLTGNSQLMIPAAVDGVGSVWLEGMAASSGLRNQMASRLNSSFDQALLDATAAASVGQEQAPEPTAPTGNTNPGALSPKDLEVQLQGGTAGVVLANDGKITIGAQILGNGSSLVSKSDITLIGTSTELSSEPGTQLGLNLYAQGKIIIDAFRLDSSGNGSFHGVSMSGILYAWQGVNILAANGASTAPVNLRGSVVGYGGDPNGDPVPGSADVKIRAGQLTVTYDPSYVASLVGSGPYTLDILSWHSF